MKKILIVDDDVRLLSTIRGVLESTGEYELMTEDSGRRAAEVAATFHPDLVILDVMMPGMDGGDVACAIHADPTTRSVPILFLTSLLSKTEGAARPRQINDEQYIAKPVDPRELCRRVAEMLGG